MPIEVFDQAFGQAHREIAEMAGKDLLANLGIPIKAARRFDSSRAMRDFGNACKDAKAKGLI